MRMTVDSVEPYILESRESIKSIVGHLMAVKAGDAARLREALHEARALSDASRRAGFVKVGQLSFSMECLIEAAEEEGAEQLSESLEVLCDICAHIVLYVDSALLYADTVAMVIEFPWMRDALTRRLRALIPEGLLEEPLSEAARHAGTPDSAEHPSASQEAADPGATLADLANCLKEQPARAETPREVSHLADASLWLVGALVSCQAACQRQGRQQRLGGTRVDEPLDEQMPKKT